MPPADDVDQIVNRIRPLSSRRGERPGGLVFVDVAWQGTAGELEPG